MVLLVIVFALLFDFTNGWNDSANSIATVVSTRVLRPGTALLYAATLNFAGAFGSTAIARMVGTGIVDPQAFGDPMGLQPVLLAATDVRTARELLWAALAAVPAAREVTVNDVTSEQRWAVDVAVAAGLSIVLSGFVCVRGMRPPAPYIPSGSFL